MTIVTKTGDKGMTGLFGGQRVSKADVRLHAYGTVDELNAVLGLARASGYCSAKLSARLLRTQNVLFRLGADLATPRENNAARVPRIEEAQIRELESWIEELEAHLPPLRQFILPGGSHDASALHLARTVCRRAERWTVALREASGTSPETVMYLNRLSDYLFLAALQANAEQGVADVHVRYE